MASENYKRFCLFPIQYPTLYDLYKKQRDAFWVPAEIDLQEDVNQWREKLTKDDKTFLTYVLAFFAQADGIVMENLDNNFTMEVDIPEARQFWGIQQGIEAIHNETYSLLIETLISNPFKKQKAFEAIEHYPSIKQKADWMLKWMRSDRPFIERLVAFACVEGIFFSAAFAAIFYFKKRGLMPGVATSNEFISRDEGLHTDFACELVKVLVSEGNPIDSQTIKKIVMEAVSIEENFVNESLNVQLIGMNSISMNEYVKFVADRLLVSLNQPKVYNIKNPFDWMTLISLTNKQNFFEGRVSEYKKTTSEAIFDTDADF